MRACLLMCLVGFLAGCSARPAPTAEALPAGWKNTSNSQFILLFQTLDKAVPGMPSPLVLATADLPAVVQFVGGWPQATVTQGEMASGADSYVELSYPDWKAIYFLRAGDDDSSRLLYVSCLVRFPGTRVGHEAPMYHKLVAAFGEPEGQQAFADEVDLFRWEQPEFVVTLRNVVDVEANSTVSVLEYWPRAHWGEDRPHLRT